MKTCRNCRVVHPDEYMGQCQECGAPMGGVPANGDSGLAFAYASQIQQGYREDASEAAMRRGDYSRTPVQKQVIDVAREYVIVDEEKLRKLQEQDDAA